MTNVELPAPDVADDFTLPTTDPEPAGASS